MSQYARFVGVSLLLIPEVIDSRGGAEQFSCTGDVGGAIAVGEEAVVTDAVQAFRQDVDQEAADELVDVERHRRVTVRAIDAVVLDPERDVVGIGFE